jgi:hypothetical protein
MRIMNSPSRSESRTDNNLATVKVKIGVAARNGVAG